jgi:signal transduction histidine kinase/CheY-like chemotaxis protein
VSEQNWDDEIDAELSRVRERLQQVANPMAMLEGVFALAPFAVQVYSSDGHCLLVNRAFRELFGSEPPPDYNVLRDDIAERQGILPLIRRAFQGDTIRVPATWYDARELKQVTVREGRRVAIEASFFPLVDEAGRVGHVAIVFREVTAELVAREIAAREAAARRASEVTREWLVQLQHVTGMLSEAASPGDVARVILDHGLTALGARRGVLGVVSEDGKDVLLLGSRGFERGQLERYQRFPAETRIPLADAIRTGEPVWIESSTDVLSAYPELAESAFAPGETSCIGAVPLATQTVFGALAFDFAEPHCFQEEEKGFVQHLARQCAQALERARLYREAKEAAARAEEATRAKDEFLSIVSHELRTPLNAILGWCHMMTTMRDTNPGIVERGLQVITRNAKAQVTIIEDILEMSRIITGKFRLSVHPVDLQSVVAAAAESVRPTATARGLSLEAELPTGVVVLGDPDRLQQVVWNLLSNAIKFTPQGGEIRVTLTEADGSAFLTVTDNGQGIQEQDLSFVFDRFRQVDSSPTRAKGGLGLGLAIVRHLVEAHGGRVQARSDGLGKGAVFEVELPLAPNDLLFDERAQERPSALPAAEGGAPSSRNLPSLSGLQVLVVDDESDAADMIGLLLGQHGAQVRLANSAAEALEALDNFVPSVIVSDIGMPEMDGLTFLRRVRTLPGAVRQVPAIALTAYASPGDAHKASEAGYAQHIPKPVDPARLVRAVATLRG